MSGEHSVAFTSIPVLDFGLVTRDGGRHKGQFLSDIRNALLNVGFLYLDNPPVDKDLLARVSAYAPKLFELPQESKDRIAMVNSEHFLGYTRFGTEITKGTIDQREQIDFAVDFENDWAPGKAEFLRLFGDAQWPREEELPGFKAAYSEYFGRLGSLSFEFMSLIAEALDLPSDIFDKFYAPGNDRVQHRGKIAKYPPVTSANNNTQGVGPHYDGQFLTFLLQVSEDLPGLQAQNSLGEWIDVPPKKGTLVVNFGKALETVTHGAIVAASHRVVSPPVGSPARYSVPFFQFVSQIINLGDMFIDVPEQVLKFKGAREDQGKVESVNYSGWLHDISGFVVLAGRIKSHPDVAERHYPDLYRKYFPNGAPALGSAY